jgi:glycerol-3-phosphate dehydrogenase
VASALIALSGPSFAREIAQGRPTSVTLACEEETYAIAVQTTLSGPVPKSQRR